MGLSISGFDANVAIAPADYFNGYFENGGNNDMGINGSVVPVSFTVSPPAGKDLLEVRILIYMEAGGNFSSTNFMNLAALSNGVRISVGGVEIGNWKDNIDVALEQFDLSNAGIAFSNERRSLTGRWTQSRGTGGKLLRVVSGEVAEFLIRDDLSAAGIIFRAKLQGRLVKVP